MYKTLSEAADYTGFTKPAFTHLFYNKFNKQRPTPSYINEGDTKTVTKNINGIDRRIKYKGMLRFHQDDLDAFLEEFRGNDS